MFKLYNKYTMDKQTNTVVNEYNSFNLIANQNKILNCIHETIKKDRINDTQVIYYIQTYKRTFRKHLNIIETFLFIFLSLFYEYNTIYQFIPVSCMGAVCIAFCESALENLIVPIHYQ